jgi:hypothetical protein
VGTCCRAQGTTADAPAVFAGLSRFVHGPEMSRFRRVRVLSVFDEVDEWL